METQIATTLMEEIWKYLRKLHTRILKNFVENGTERHVWLGSCTTWSTCISSLSCSRPSLLLTHTLRSNPDGSRTATETWSSRLRPQPGPALTASLWGVNQWVDDCSVFVFLFLYLSNKMKGKRKEKSFSHLKKKNLPWWKKFQKPSTQGAFKKSLWRGWWCGVEGYATTCCAGIPCGRWFMSRLLHF